MNAPGAIREADAPTPIRPQIESATGELERINRQVRTFVTEKPVVAVLLALTAGYVTGRIISRLS